MKVHAWRLFRVALRYQLLSLVKYAPLKDVPLPGWLHLLARLTSSRTDTAEVVGKRLANALIELGPVYIKLGQLVSTRPDVVPPEIALALSRLQDRVPPFSASKAMQIIEAGLGRPLETVFSEIETTPLASASIAQVHAARLLNGESVVIKVVRPDIQTSIEETLQFLDEAARRLEARSRNIRRLRLRQIVDDYDRTIHAELDLAQEARNTSTLRSNFAHSRLLYVPRVHHALCSTRVMVMERITGIPISAIEQMDAAGVDKALLANRGVETFFQQVFVDNFFHADMHPGNVFVDISNPEDPRYIALDCAIIGSLTTNDQEYLARNLVAFFNRDYRGVAQLHIESGWVPASTDLREFASVIEEVCEPHFAKPLGEISFGEFLTALFQTAERFNMQIQPQLVLLQKTLLYVEGLGRMLYPQLDLWQTAKPFMEKWLLTHHGPVSVLQQALTKLPETLVALSQLPAWLPQVRGRLLVMEQQQAEQAEMLAALIETRLTSTRRQLRSRFFAVVMIAGGAFLLWDPLGGAALQGQLWQTSAGLAGAVTGLTLWLRNL